MDEYKPLPAAVKRIAWGYLLIHLHFNLGTIDLLPDWLGYWFMLSALPVLAEEVPTASLLRPFGILLTGWYAVDWVLKMLGTGVGTGILSLLVSIVSLYFHFQLLTDLAAISEKYGCPQTARLRTLRTVQTVVCTILALPLNWVDWEPLAYIVLFAGIIAAIWIAVVLFSLRRSLEDPADPPPTESF